MAQGYADASNGQMARFNVVGGLAVTNDGVYIYVADEYNHRVRRVKAKTGETTTFAGDGESLVRVGLPALESSFNYPESVTLAPDGTELFLACKYSVLKISISTGFTALVAGDQKGDSDGFGEAAFSTALRLTFARDGLSLFISDMNNHKIRRFSLLTNQTTTVAGQTGVTGSADGVPSEASLVSPVGMSVSPDGQRLYFAQKLGHNVRMMNIMETHCECEHGTSLEGYMSQVYAHGQVNKTEQHFCYEDGVYKCISCEDGHMLTNFLPGYFVVNKDNSSACSVAMGQFSAQHPARCCYDGPCAEVGWEENMLGHPSICGGTDESGLGCSGEVSHAEARAHCEAMGGRLCTVDELLSNETQGTGCDYDDRGIWSDTFESDCPAPQPVCAGNVSLPSLYLSLSLSVSVYVIVFLPVSASSSVYSFSFLLFAYLLVHTESVWDEEFVFPQMGSILFSDCLLVFVFLCVCVCMCMYVCMSVCLSVCVSVCPVVSQSYASVPTVTQPCSTQRTFPSFAVAVELIVSRAIRVSTCPPLRQRAAKPVNRTRASAPTASLVPTPRS